MPYDGKQSEAQAEKQGPSAVVRYWTNEIAAARKREKEYRKEGERVRAIYAGEKKNTTPFNILYSNTETLLPALYSSTPKPVVQRRFKDADPIARAAAMAGQRCLEFLLDTNVDEYAPFDDTLRDAVLDALLPGRGVARVKYEAEVTPVPQEGGEPTEEKTYETVCTELVAWNRVYFGFCKKWTKCPWIAFEHYLDKDEATKKFGEPVANKMIFTVTDEDEKKDEDKTRKGDVDEGSDKRTCLVYEIWKRKGRKVCFFAPNYIEGYLKEDDDPLELTGFYPLPKPVRFLAKTEDLTPTALYLLYENQAKELNKISVRINRVVEAIKVRGAYDGSLGDTLKDVLSGDDNALIPTSNASNIALEGGLEKYIWLMPLDKLVQVLAQLIIARQECKQIIYEVTGLSDIIRGATDANETATAQQIKQQWGSLRIKMLQKEVRRYVRDMLRIMLEIAAKRFSPETFAKMTGLPFTTAQAKQQAQQLLAAVQQQGAQTGMTLEQAPPQVQQSVQKAQQTMQTPDWEQVLALLRDDLSRAYRIDIETNSTVEVNEMEDKQNITEAMTAIGGFLEGVTPLVQAGVMPFEAAKSMLLAIVRRFQFGTEVEEEIKTMQAPQRQPGAEEVKAEKEKLEAAAREEQLSTELTKEKAGRETDKREADLKAREEAVKHAEEVFALKQQQCAEIDGMRQEREAERKTVEKERDGERQQAAKREIETVAKVADERVKHAQSATAKLGAPADAAKAMQDVVSQFVEAMQQQQQENAALIKGLVDAVNAPIDVERDPKSNRVVSMARRKAA